MPVRLYCRQAPPGRRAPPPPAGPAPARQRFAALLAAFAVFAPAAAGGQAVTAPLDALPNPALQNRSLSNYDEKLNRLAEILGSLHYLYNLCGGQNNEWRNYMQKLLPALQADNKQQLRLYAAFNRSYRAFADNYGACTKAAREAAGRYRLEGLNLSRHLLEQFGSDPSAL